MIVYLKLKFCR